jgi:hypothetical protein
MENLQLLIISAYAILAGKLIWALSVPAVILIIIKKIWSITPRWISVMLFFAAGIHFLNGFTILFSRMLSVQQYSQVALLFGIANTIGIGTFIAAVYGMAVCLHNRSGKNNAADKTAPVR